jgi:hypothetical protein
MLYMYMYKYKQAPELKFRTRMLTDVSRLSGCPDQGPIQMLVVRGPSRDSAVGDCIEFLPNSEISFSSLELSMRGPETLAQGFHAPRTFYLCDIEQRRVSSVTVSLV